MALSLRLQQLKSFYNGAFEVWDIGCDHGQLGLSFYGRAQEIHLVDPSPLVVKVLVQKVKSSDIPAGSIFIHQKKGQDIKLNSKRKKCLFIAGMGGEEILEIALALESKLTSEDLFIISPHRKVLSLRKNLHFSKFRLFNEGVILDRGLFYPYLCLSKDLTFPQVSFYGHSNFWSTEVGRAYLQHQKKNYSHHKDQISMDYIAYLNSLSK